MENDDIDASSVKQLKFQLEGAGKFFIDEITLIEFSKNQYENMLQEVESMKPKGAKKQQIYKEGNLIKSAWATGRKLCHSLEEAVDSTEKGI